MVKIMSPSVLFVKQINLTLCANGAPTAAYVPDIEPNAKLLRSSKLTVCRLLISSPYALSTKKSNWISAVVVLAPVPFVTTIARDPEDAVLLLMLSAEPVVAPLILRRTSVIEAVIAEVVIVNVKSAAAAMLTLVKVEIGRASCRERV